MRSILRFWAVPTTLVLISCAIALPAAPAVAQTMDHGEMATGSPATPSVGQALFDKLRGLVGTWDAKLGNGVMTDTFKPFAFDTAVLGEEWLNGKQITSTVFYVVNGELRADHYCDYLNQPRYTAVPSLDPDILDFQFREATNLDTHPKHFHGTKWKIVDSTHLIQDWFVMGGKNPVSLAHMEFTKRAGEVPPPQLK
ncbi:MAG: hypothetical protein QOI59_157 [Gammaproteobacteria bacterium]|jgi:hypothetical protein|nr:hypothetical protein [Gammaproteobacteria bacterium]